MSKVVKPNIINIGEKINVKQYKFNNSVEKINDKITEVHGKVQGSFDAVNNKVYETVDAVVTPEVKKTFSDIDGKIESILGKFHIFDDITNGGSTETSPSSTVSPEQTPEPTVVPSEKPTEAPTPKPTETPSPKPSETPKPTSTPKPKETPKPSQNPSTSSGYSNIPAVKTSNLDPSGELPGSTNDEKIWLYCKSKGYTDAQAAAVVGNARVESWNWDYALRNSKNGQYYGLFMNSHQYASEYNGKTAKQQLDLMNKDLAGRMKYWHSRGYGAGYGAWQSCSGANDVNAATSAFMYGYEGTLRDQMLKERQQYAREAYQKFAGKY